MKRAFLCTAVHAPVPVADRIGFFRELALGTGFGTLRTGQRRQVDVKPEQGMGKIMAEDTALAL